MKAETKLITIIEWIDFPDHVRDMYEIKGNDTYMSAQLEFFSVANMQEAYKNDEVGEDVTFEDWIKENSLESEYELLKLYPEGTFKPDVDILIKVCW